MAPAQIHFRFLKTCEHNAAMKDPVFSRSGRSSSVKKTNSHFQLADCAPRIAVSRKLQYKDNNSNNGSGRVHSSQCHRPSDMSSEANDFLAAVVKATTLCPDALDAGSMDFNVANHVATAQSSLADMHDADSILLSMAPSKRFYRRHWQSVSQRLLHRWTSIAGRPSQRRRPGRWLDQG